MWIRTVGQGGDDITSTREPVTHQDSATYKQYLLSIKPGRAFHYNNINKIDFYQQQQISLGNPEKLNFENIVFLATLR